MKKEDFEMEIRKEYRDLQGRIIRRIEELKGKLERIEASRILLRVSREEHYRLVMVSMTIGSKLDDVIKEHYGSTNL